MPKQLTDLDVFEVSTVDRGANRKKFIILKNLEGLKVPNEKEILEKILETKLDVKDEKKIDEFLAKQEIDEETKRAVKAALRVLESIKEKVPADVMSKLTAMLGMSADNPSDEENKSTEEDEKKEEAIKGEIKKSDIDTKGMSDVQKKNLDALFKSSDADKERLEKVEKSLGEERVIRRKKEFLEKALELKHVPGNPEDLSSIMMEIEDKSPKLFEKVHSLLKTADKAIKEGNIFSVNGGDGDAPSDAMDEIKKIAKELRKSDSNLSEAQAITKAVEQNSELYAKHKKEKDLTLLQHRFVIVSASEQVNVAGVAASAIGVLQNKPNTGQAAEVVAAGVSNVIASAAITAGTDLATAANGKVAAATAGQNVVGKAIQAASNDDDIISALIFFAPSP